MKMEEMKNVMDEIKNKRKELHAKMQEKAVELLKMANSMGEKIIEIEIENKGKKEKIVIARNKNGAFMTNNDGVYYISLYETPSVSILLEGVEIMKKVEEKYMERIAEMKKQLQAVKI